MLMAGEYVNSNCIEIITDERFQFVPVTVTLNHLKDHTNCIKAFERAVAMAPDDITIRLNYVNFFVYQNQFDLAKYHLNVAEDLAAQIQNLDREVRYLLFYDLI